ncbi:MAG: 4Fe-4S binding protein [Spirochaetales bacterium]|nr:4Fe-4S binding protein [Spirochaetales bacterium]
MEKFKTTADLETFRRKITSVRPAPKISITISVNSSCCILRGSKTVAAAFKDELESQGLNGKIEVLHTGCLGFCEIEPVVIIQPANILYGKVSRKDVKEIVARTVKNGEVLERLLYKDPVSGEKIRGKGNIPFYQKQMRHILGRNEVIDPRSIDDYIKAGGYSALTRTLDGIAPTELVNMIKESGLRGRGGGGFPVGLKWISCRDAPCDDGIRYVICNADEGDPGAYMDRSILEGNPHSVIEGMIIASFGIGAGEGWVYVRAEYPLAVEHLNIALSQALNYGLLGENILGSGHSFSINVARGAGAFVCGESTALMASLEGKVGRPRSKYVHTVEKGLFDRPSSLNNVETFANVSLILEKGVEGYREIGTEGSKGTKIFSLVGKINNTGLVEVPMGITLREIIYDIGGGIPGGKRFKAVQTGGPSGGCIPERLLDLSVDFDALKEAGSIMGSGGMIVMDEDTCMVDVARYFMNFLKGESCGKCVPCREGTRRMSEILERICLGGGEMEDLEVLEDVCEYLPDTALCALGATAANPVLSTLKYFRNEYTEHIKQKFCRAGVCKTLFRYEIDKDLCTGCTLCSMQCPVNAISGERKKAHIISADVCSRCGICYESCRFGAVKIIQTGAAV